MAGDVLVGEVLKVIGVPVWVCNAERLEICIIAFRDLGFRDLGIASELGMGEGFWGRL